MTGQTLGHYQVHEQIGSGGMGEVYRATDGRLGRDVALKFLKPSLANDQDRLRRFEQEARAAAALNHPNIVAIYDIGVHEGRSYIVSELLQGQTLRQRLREGPLSLRQAADYASQIAQGLIAAHERHIVHRDLKPENLFLTKDGRVKILDFGIAKLTLPEASALPEQSIAMMTTQTRTGSVLGTVAYMSPEQLRAKPVDHRSDLFSFGAILYEMLTGKRAFSGETDVDTMTAVLKDDPPEMLSIRQSIPEAFDQIVRHCLEKDTESRFQSARDLAFALGAASNLTTGRSVALSPVKFRVSKWLALAAGILLVVATGVLLAPLIRPAAAPIYRRVTFERGTLYSARFTPDGRSLVYAASWNGKPLQLYSTPVDALQARPLDLGSAYLLGISRSSELALELNGIHGAKLEFLNGTLARAPLVGGAPREILLGVAWADWDAQDGIAVDHYFGGRSHLEYPIGKVLYETTGAISNLRFSPQGDRIAFIDHPSLWDDRGSICVVDLAGHKTTLSSGWGSAAGLAWNPKGDEIWFSAVREGPDRSLWAVTLSGKLRQVVSVPGSMDLQDIAPDGRVLVSLGNERLAMEIAGQDIPEAQDLSWYNWTIAKDISRDGQWVLFEESGEASGANYAVGIRKTDGSYPIRLGEGSAGGLSPDGKWALAIVPGSPERIVLLPTGPGQPSEVSLPGIEHVENGLARFLPDGKRILFFGNEPGRPARTYVQDLSGGKPKAITPEGVQSLICSPDGKYVAAWRKMREIVLYSIAGGEPRALPVLPRDYELIQWSADGASLYLSTNGEVPLQVYSLNLATGKLQLVRQLTPLGQAGVVSIDPLVVSPDASRFLYSYFQELSDLYVISELK
jgi:Tol biopolymer transport system component